MDIIFLMFVVLFGSFVLGHLFGKFNLPKVLGPLILGVIFTIKFINVNLIDENTMAIFDFVKDIAIIFLLFFVGLKIDIKDFKKSSKRSISIGFFASIIPFVFSFFLIYILGANGFLGNIFTSVYDLILVAFVFGICFSVTAEEVIIGILEDMKLIKTGIGETIIEAGIVDDIIGIFLITILATFIPGGAGSGSAIGYSIFLKFFHMLLFIGFIYVMAHYVVPYVMRYVEKDQSTVSFFGVSLMITLFLVVLTQYFDLGGSILGSLFAGVIIRHTLLRGDNFEQKEEKYITDIIEVTTFGFFAPFFFVWIGLNTDVSVFVDMPFIVIIVVILVILTKIFGTMLGNHIAKGKVYEAYIIGWGMNAKGGVDIMIAMLALSAGVISNTLFSLLVSSSFIITLISPIVFKYLIQKHHRIKWVCNFL